MPDLATKAIDVLARAQSLKDAERSRQAESQFAQRKSMLEQLERRLQVDHEFRLAASTIGISIEPDPSLLRRALERLKSTEKNFKENREGILDETNFRILMKTLEQAAEALEQAEVAGWAHYAKQALPPPLGGDEQLLRADPRTDSAIVDRLVQWDQFLRQVADKPRPTSAELSQFNAVLENRQAVWATIHIEQEPEVVEFIRASGAQGAPLRLLTERVRAWLVERGLLDAYTIKKKD